MPINDEHGLVTDAFFKGARLGKGESIRPHPFKVMVTEVGEDFIKCHINPLSFFYTSPDGRELVDVGGKDGDKKMSVGDEINLSVGYNKKGFATYCSVSTSSFSVITALITQSEAASLGLTGFFDDAPRLLGKPSAGYSSSSPQPKANWRKQYRSYIPVAKLISPPDPEMAGEVFKMGDGTLAQVVQQLNTNLVLVDSFYDNTYPIKVPIPFGVDTSTVKSA